MYSIRRRLTLLLVAGFTVLLLGTGVYVERLLEERVTEEFDAALVTRARVLVSLTEQENGQIEFDYAPEFMPEFERSDRPAYLQFWLDDGRVLFRSGRLGSADLPRSETLPSRPRAYDLDLPDGRAGRAVQIAFVPRGPEAADDSDEVSDAAKTVDRSVVLVVARGRARLDGLLGSIRWAVLGAGVAAVVLAAVFAWRAIVAGLRPVEAIAAQVETLDAEKLDTRVQLRKTPRELAPVVEQLNALLGRLEASFERERRFAGNVAHELRTPIAELRALAEVGARWPEDEAAVARFFDDAADIAGRMEGMVADLLLLARCQAGVERAVSSPTRLEDVITSTWSKVAPAASVPGLRFHLELPENLVVDSDPGKLAIVFTNVLGNAVSYARPHSEIRCVGTKNGITFRLDITNAAEPLSRADLDHLAEPFWRKDEARASADHAGLGLSVVSALARLLRLEVAFDQDRDGTFRVRLRGPAHA